MFPDQILFLMYELDDCFVVSTPNRTEGEKKKKKRRRRNHTVSFREGGGKNLEKILNIFLFLLLLHFYFVCVEIDDEG